MRQAVRAIIIHQQKLLVMQRNKFGQQYYTLVGGGIDYGEKAQTSLVREVQEETGLKIANPRLVFIEQAGDPYGIQYHYLVDYVSGEPRLDPASEEAKITSLGQNLYKPMWLALAELPDAIFFSQRLKVSILDALKNGWPGSPVDITSHVF